MNIKVALRILTTSFYKYSQPRERIEIMRLTSLIRINLRYDKNGREFDMPKFNKILSI